MQILDIFLLCGAPNILQSDNGAEFTANIISELKNLWPECKSVHEKPRHPHSQGSVELANADDKDMIITWMLDNHCINRAPYTAMFGIDPRVGLASSSLPDELIAKIDCEENLSDLANMELNRKTDDENTCTTDDEAMEISEPQPTEPKTDMCVVCEATALNATSCSSCNKTVHALCGKSVKIVGQGFLKCGCSDRIDVNKIGVPVEKQDNYVTVD
ncbi:unnamed protein product [Mytilus edulis]|uniref:Integrase catalytic domain-containing protein n=1 Tax=Mytilus edulis TaxID=6550 RepID=A0A8S3RVL1_MYTED|nr:unnamed protein product [Mytilus edulis]